MGFLEHQWEERMEARKLAQRRRRAARPTTDAGDAATTGATQPAEGRGDGAAGPGTEGTPHAVAADAVVAGSGATVPVSDPLSVALAWAAVGVAAFPVALGWDAAKEATSKRPLTKNGHLDASDDVQVLVAMFEAALGRLRDGEVVGVGVVYGRGGLVAFDVDRKNGKDGFPTADRIGMPTEVVVRTPSGGAHRLVHKLDPTATVGNVTAWADNGIDVRADDGWVVAPGTCTPWGAWTATLTPQEIIERAPSCPPDLWGLLINDRSGRGRGGLRWQRYDPTKVHEVTARTVDVLIEQYGAHDPVIINNGDEPYVQVTRPGKEAGSSASVGWIGPGVVKVWTSNWDGLPAGRYELDQLRDGAPDTTSAAAVITRRYVDRTGVDVPALAADALGDGIIRRGHDGRLYRYENGLYRPDGEDYLRARCRELLGHDFKRHYVEEVIGWFRMQLSTIGDRPPLQYINVRNGLLDWNAGVLHPHDPAVLSTAQLPVAWNPHAQADAFRRFLSEVLPGCETFVEELFGYALYPGLPIHVAVLCLGRGRNGKSTLLRVLRALLGEDNCSSVSLQALGENRFAAAHLYGKLANVCGDLDARAIKRTDIWKQVTGEDTIMAEHKYRDPFQFKSHALQLFSANEAPISADQTDAWFDRWIILPFEQRFAADGHKPDVHLTAKLTTPDELEGVLVLAIEGLRRLMTRGAFDKPEPIRRAGDRYRERLDTVRAFITEECTLAPNVWIARSELYEHYSDYCRRSGRYPLSAVTFNERLRHELGDKISERQRKQGGVNQGKCWFGIRG
jgi:P4 family phage/plasmid primase-like protien